MSSIWDLFSGNTLVWYPQMAMGVEFAQGSRPRDWKMHLTHSWVWDNDEFSVNQIGHPYQGSLPYTTARGAGWDFSASLSSVLSGKSFLGTLHGKMRPPSRNDFVVTTLGGAALGEMLFRSCPRRPGLPKGTLKGQSPGIFWPGRSLPGGPWDVSYTAGRTTGDCAGPP